MSLKLTARFKGVLIGMTGLVAIFLFSPSIGLAQSPIRVDGTAEGDITVWIPVETPLDVRNVLVTADYIAEQDLPRRVSYPPYTVGQAFTLGIWKGDASTYDQFVPSIVINVKYQDADLLEDQRSNEQNIHLYMYDPTARSWNKLCSSVDVHENLVSAALSYATPLDGKGSALFALAIDQTPPPEQEVDGEGTTTLTIPGHNLRVSVLRDEVAVGSHFVITALPNSAGSRSVKLLARPMNVKVCRIDYDRPFENNREIVQFFRPPRIGFAYDADALSRAGDMDNLTIANVRRASWVDIEEIGARVVRSLDSITVSTGQLGTFGLAVR